MFWGNHKVLTPNAHCSYWQEHTDRAQYVPACVCISLKYNQQDATFSRSIYFYKLLHMFQAVPPPIIRSTKLYTHRQILSNQSCCLLLSWIRWNLRSTSSTIATGSSIGLTISDDVCTVLCSWWWAEEPPETCGAIYRNKWIEKTLRRVGCTLEIYLWRTDIRTSKNVCM